MRDTNTYLEYFYQEKKTAYLSRELFFTVKKTEVKIGKRSTSVNLVMENGNHFYLMTSICFH